MIIYKYVSYKYFVQNKIKVKEVHFFRAIKKMKCQTRLVGHFIPISNCFEYIWTWDTKTSQNKTTKVVISDETIHSL